MPTGYLLNVIMLDPSCKMLSSARSEDTNVGIVWDNYDLRECQDLYHLGAISDKYLRSVRMPLITRSYFVTVLQKSIS